MSLSKASFLVLVFMATVSVNNLSVKSATNNFVIYQNKELGISFQYPKDWELIISKSNGLPLISLYDPEAIKARSAGDTELSIGAKIEINTINYRIPESIRAYSEKEPQVGIKIKGPEDVLVDSKVAIKQSQIFEGKLSTKYLISDGPRMYQAYLIVGELSSDSNSVNQYEAIFESIINTLKFSKQ